MRPRTVIEARDRHKAMIATAQWFKSLDGDATIRNALFSDEPWMRQQLALVGAKLKADESLPIQRMSVIEYRGGKQDGTRLGFFLGCDDPEALEPITTIAQNQ